MKTIFLLAWLRIFSPTFYIINSTDKKTKKLIAKYGEDIFGLTKESKAQFVEERLRKGLSKYIFQTTGLVFR